METALADPTRKYTVKCVHCARTVFRDARRIGEVQLVMIESHLLVCRPLAAIEQITDLLEHCKITEATA